MKKEPLLKALKYAFIPTLLLIVVTLLTTLSFEKTYQFFMSPNSNIVRLCVIIIEVFLFYFLYVKYNKEQVLKDAINDKNLTRGETIKDSYTWASNFFSHDSYGDTYTLFKTEDRDVIVIKRNFKSDL